jgi:hypothetical protein
MGLRVSLTRRPSSFRRTSANDRPEETLTCSTAIVCDVTEYCVGLCHVRSRFASSLQTRRSCASPHGLHLDERVEYLRPPFLNVDVALQSALQQSLDSLLRFGPRQHGPKGGMPSSSRSADGNETWLTRFFAAAMARRSKEAVRRASASTKPTFTKNPTGCRTGRCLPSS